MIFLPKDVVNIILEYDGQIRYRNGEYINIIPKTDKRYSMVNAIIKKKINILKNIVIEKNGDSFFFDFRFDGKRNAGLSYACGVWSGAAYTQKGKLEISFYIFKKFGISDDRTYL